MPGKPPYIVTYYHKDEGGGFYTRDFFGPATTPPSSIDTPRSSASTSLALN